MPEDVVQQLADMVAAAALEQPVAEADQNWQEQSDEVLSMGNSRISPPLPPF